MNKIEYIIKECLRLLVCFLLFIIAPPLLILLPFVVAFQVVERKQLTTYDKILRTGKIPCINPLRKVFLTKVGTAYRLHDVFCGVDDTTSATKIGNPDKVKNMWQLFALTQISFAINETPEKKNKNKCRMFYLIVLEKNADSIINVLDNFVTAACKENDVKRFTP